MTLGTEPEMGRQGWPRGHRIRRVGPTCVMGEGSSTPKKGRCRGVVDDVLARVVREGRAATLTTGGGGRGG